MKIEQIICSCGSRLFIKTTSFEIGTLLDSENTGLNFCQKDELADPKVLYSCLKCGNEDF